MRNLLFFIIFVFLLNSCVGVESNLKKGNIFIGMYKYQFCDVDTKLSGPCGGTFMDGFNNISGGLYYPNIKKELMWARKNAKHFFVFENVTRPFNYDTLKTGNGRLEKIFETKEEAIQYVSKIAFTINKDDVYIAKQGCKAEGLEPGTEEFGKCSLKRIKELTSGTGQ